MKGTVLSGIALIAFASICAAQSDQQIVSSVREKSMRVQSDARWERVLAQKGGENRVIHMGMHWSNRDRTAETAVYHLAKGKNVAEQNKILRGYVPNANRDSFKSLVILFGAKSKHFPGKLEDDVEKAMKEVIFRGVQKSRSAAECLSAANKDPAYAAVTLHNITTRAQVRDYLKLQALHDDPDFMNRKFDNGDTVLKRYEAHNKKWQRGLKDLALHGIFVEFASGHYETRTYSALYELLYYASDPIVAARIRMLMDITFIENALIALKISKGAWARGGVKCRAKPPSGGMGSRFEGDQKAFYGDEVGMLEAPGMKVWRPPVPAILLRYKGKAVPVYEVANRFPSQYGKHGIKLRGKRYNYAYMTPEYVIGCGLFDPNVFKNKNSNRGSFASWSGVIHRDPDGGRRRGIYIDAFTQEKWNVQYKDVMITQRWAGGYYGGDPKVDIRPGYEIAEKDGWVFANNENEAYTAVRIIDGGHTKKKKGDGHLTLMLKDEWSPIIFQTGRKADYGSFAGFQDRILKAPLEYTKTKLEYTGPNSPKIVFFPTRSAPYKLPTIDGKVLDFDPEYNYHSPYMVSKAGSDVVTVHYGSRKWVYDFRKNTVTEGSGGRQIAGVRPGSSSKEPGGLLKGTRPPAGGAAKPEAVRVWEGKLRARAAATAAAGNAPQFKMTLLKATVEFKSLEGDRGEVILQGGGTIAIQWNQLTAADHRNLAVSLAKATDAPQDHALAAFYLLLVGRTKDADRHLGRARKLADEVRKAFGQ